MSPKGKLHKLTAEKNTLYHNSIYGSLEMQEIVLVVGDSNSNTNTKDMVANTKNTETRIPVPEKAFKVYFLQGINASPRALRITKRLFSDKSWQGKIFYKVRN